MVADIQEQKEATFEVAQSPLHNATINLLFEPTTIGYSHSSLLEYKKKQNTHKKDNRIHNTKILRNNTTKNQLNSTKLLP